MLTDQLTKSQFIVEVLNRDVNNIYRAQLLMAQHNIQLTGKELKTTRRRGGKIGSRSGSLIRALQNPQYQIYGKDGRFQLEAIIPTHARFLDMKRRHNWRIYNRQVWGILYRNSMLDIKYGYKKGIQDTVGRTLTEAFKTARK